VLVSLRRPSRGGRRSLGGQHRQAPGADRVVDRSTLPAHLIIELAPRLSVPFPSCKMWPARARRHCMRAKPLCLPVQANDARCKACPGCCPEGRWQQCCGEAIDWGVVSEQRGAEDEG